MAIHGFDHKLSWNDFTKVLVPKSGYSENAHIEPKWKVFLVPKRAGNAIVIDLSKAKLEIHVSVEESWVVAANASGPDQARLLNHEQGHFDITAIAAREYWDKLASIKVSTQAELKQKMKELRESIDENTLKADKKYDTETKNSTDSAAQNKWDHKIKACKDNPSGIVTDLL